MRIGAFIIGTLIASLMAGIVAALVGFGWMSVAIAMAVLILSQFLYAVTIAVLAFGRTLRARRDGAENGPSHIHDPAHLGGGNMTQK